ncbi:hypothetical protein F383_36285 [Gossypium arboreum]|uniref:Uncharacterized protein n=1 Tax=Gossypium arboreum TaxID=29729 RepID=A0A0B0N819_GOSAR|nr:hypothetical protein F383_36285 [Gossypium arboreum]
MHSSMHLVRTCDLTIWYM